MLTGLLFATRDVPTEPGRLVATLPFAGTTVIERQARQLVAAGAVQLVVIGSNPTPELLGALHRIGRRGVAIDVAHGIADAAGALHPLARVVALADGLVAADATIAAMASEGGEAILVVAADEAPPSFELIGGAAAWAGIARIDPRRLAEVAALPTDYDPQSTLLRVTEAGGASRVALPAGALGEHGVESEPGAMARLELGVIAGHAASRDGWYDRFVAGPLARVAMPALVSRGVSPRIAGGVTAGAASAAVAALIGGWPRVGMILAVAATLAAGLAAALADLRDERSIAVPARAARAVVPFGAVLLLGYRAGDGGGGVPLVLAVALVVAAVIGARAAPRPKGWWGEPPAYALVVAAITLIGWPVVGLAIGACYAAATLAAAVEDLRGEA